MPTDVLNLDDLLGEDLPIVWRGETYYFPGDIDTETTFVLGEMVRHLAVAETLTDVARIELGKAVGLPATQKAAKQVDDLERKQKDLTLKVEAKIFECFKRRHPDLEQFPFGARGAQAILAKILVQLGYGGADEQPDPPKPNRQQRRAAGRKRSQRSSS